MAQVSEFLVVNLSIDMIDCFLLCLRLRIYQPYIAFIFFPLLCVCRVVVQGQGPGPRYGHVMDLVAQRFFVTVSGNDGQFFKLSSFDAFLNLFSGKTFQMFICSISIHYSLDLVGDLNTALYLYMKKGIT